MEGNILEAKGGVVRCCARVLAWTKEEVEGDDAHVGDRLASGEREIAKGLLKDVDDDDDGDRFYP
jgi:hypothetical protein